MYINFTLYGQFVLFGIFGKIYIQSFQSLNKQFKIQKHQLKVVNGTDPNTYLHISAPLRS